MAELFVGLLSGTSVDSIDAVLVDLERPQPVVVQTHNHPVPAPLRRALIALNTAGENEIERLGRADIEMGRLFAAATLALLEKSRLDPCSVTAIGSHGQTVRHRPAQAPPFTLQIGDPNTIAQLTGVTTVADFRRRDLSAGGEGAPLTPALHAVMFRTAHCDRVILNIGGIANVTLLPADPNAPIHGFDTGPGNALMDSWAERHLGVRLDHDGAWAASGRIDSRLLSALRSDRFFGRHPPKSTGRDYFSIAWLDQYLTRAPEPYEPRDVQATLCELTAASIADAVEHYAESATEVLVCGGGVHNRALIARLSARLASPRVCSTAEYGLDPDWVEAVTFAWLAKQALAGRAGNVPTVTGAREPVPLGGIYPGRIGCAPVHSTP